MENGTPIISSLALLFALIVTVAKLLQVFGDFSDDLKDQRDYDQTVAEEKSRSRAKRYPRLYTIWALRVSAGMQVSISTAPTPRLDLIGVEDTITVYKVVGRKGGDLLCQAWDNQNRRWLPPTAEYQFIPSYEMEGVGREAWIVSDRTPTSTKLIQMIADGHVPLNSVTAELALNDTDNAVRLAFARECMEECGQTKKTPLHLNLSREQTEIIKALIQGTVE